MINLKLNLEHKDDILDNTWIQPGCGQPAQDEDVVPDQRHQEHDWRQEDTALA